MMTGYAYEQTTKRPSQWRYSNSENWEIAVYDATGRELFLGVRKIDGIDCNVWQCRDGIIRAQSCLDGYGRKVSRAS